MFSGIVEAKTELLSFTRQNSQEPQIIRIKLKKPSEFNDIKPGDSIAVNGICLTVESHNENEIEFALGAETIKVTGWTEADLRSQSINLERSLRFGDRLHGHMVSGHVDAMGTVTEASALGGSWILKVRVPEYLADMIWPKGSVAINGVSLTVNAIHDNSIVEVCLIPETLKRTNLSEIQFGNKVTIEVDPMARALKRMISERNEREQHH
jgi:riboflavin synthase